MKLCIATVSISGNLEEKIEAIAAAGFDGIEIFEQDFIADARSPQEIGQRIRAAGLEPLLFQPFRDFEGLPGGLRQKAFDRAERKFDLMQELGTDLVLVCSSIHPEALGGIDRAADDFAELGERARNRGLRVGYEALAWGRHVNDHRDAWEIVRRANHPNIGLILDSFHTLARKIDPDTIRRIPADKIFFVQLADAPKIEMDLLYWSRHFRNMPGEGDLDVAGFLGAVMATGYNGPISLEIFNDQFRGAQARQIASDGHRSLVAILDRVRRDAPDVAIDLPPMPPRAPVLGTAFLEFASRGPEANELEGILAALGMRKVGRHITKDLALWQQGDIRILVNRETKGAAATAYNVHGTSICDIGLSVPDATAVVARARLLGAPPFAQPRTPGEMDIPAIGALAGSILHFIDEAHGLSDVWQVEFEPETPFQADGPATVAGVGLTRVDHIAQTMSYDEMLSWSLFYKTLFAVESAPMVDVIDPDGLVRSQAIEAPDGGFRITLNGAETHRTLAGKFLAESFGATVQHMALATEDIFATSAQLNAAGFERLPIPANYYADLAARFDLPSELALALEAENLLYDRDAEGEFFQLYSKPFQNGFFFEIVQRKGGYRGYGAPNAPFRIAALKRLMRPKGMPRG